LRLASWYLGQNRTWQAFARFFLLSRRAMRSSCRAEMTKGKTLRLALFYMVRRFFAGMLTALKCSGA
jgi:hypothetical protein